MKLFSVGPWDPVMLASATLALGLAALLASTLPAWRAAGVEPLVALRNECGMVSYLDELSLRDVLRKVNPFRVIPGRVGDRLRSPER
jgi:hypothetical protein